MEFPGKGVRVRCTWVLICFVSSTILAAQTRGTPGAQGSNSRPAGPANPSTAPNVSSLIKVTIYPSRNEVVPNGSYGVYSDLENISSRQVLILPDQTALVVLPEASEPSACVDWEPRIFPTEPPRQNGGANAVPWDGPVLIQPGEHYLVFWDLEPDSQKKKATYHGNCKLPPPVLGALGFVPGDYAFAVEGNAYVEPEGSAAPTTAAGSNPPAATPSSSTPASGASPSSAGSQSYVAGLVALARSGAIPAHHFSETKTLHVGISQITTLIASMIGAFLAYWVVALQKDGDWDKAVESIADAKQTHKKWMAVLSLGRNALLAALLGGVVTIVASRLSDTHFPVKVSVNDFWGALTIGFVAFFVGNKFISELVKLGTDPNKLGTPKPSNEPSNPSGTTASLSPTPSPMPAADAQVRVVSSTSPISWTQTGTSSYDEPTHLG